MGTCQKLNFCKMIMRKIQTSSSESSSGWDGSSREETLILSSALTRTLCLDSLEFVIPESLEKETFWGNRVEREIGDGVATVCLFVSLCGGAKWEPIGNTAIGEHRRERGGKELRSGEKAKKNLRSYGEGVWDYYLSLATEVFWFSIYPQNLVFLQFNPY